MKIQFEELFWMARDPNCSVADCREEGSWTMDFKRALPAQEYDQWFGLVDTLNKIPVTQEVDSVKWALDKSKSYTTKFF